MLLLVLLLQALLHPAARGSSCPLKLCASSRRCGSAKMWLFKRQQEAWLLISPSTLRTSSRAVAPAAAAVVVVLVPVVVVVGFHTQNWNGVGPCSHRMAWGVWRAALPAAARPCRRVWSLLPLSTLLKRQALLQGRHTHTSRVRSSHPLLVSCTAPVAAGQGCRVCCGQERRAVQMQMQLQLQTLRASPLSAAAGQPLRLHRCTVAAPAGRQAAGLPSPLKKQ